MGSSQPVARRNASPPATDTVSLSTSGSLNSQMSQMSTVRPEEVARAKSLVSDTQYPPDYVLKRIAVLLAINPNSSSSEQSGPPAS